MCAIVDANRASEVFGENKTKAGRAFLYWLVQRHGRLIVGGKVRRELATTPAQNWLKELTLAGRVHAVDDKQVDATTEAVRGRCQSDDPHIIAPARLSGARLLYSNDKALHQDFDNPQLINKPRGKIFSTTRSDRLSRHHQQLLRRTDLCSAAG